MSPEPDLSAIKHRAASRARELGLRYAGALLPAEAHALMRAGAKLVDVRTRPELVYVGRVPGSVLIEWQSYPDYAVNPRFLEQLAEAAEPGDTLMFICRSGNRSDAAAAVAAQAGFHDSYNVLEGFEGDKDAEQHRGNVNGWRRAGLPWVQS